MCPWGVRGSKSIKDWKDRTVYKLIGLEFQRIKDPKDSKLYIDSKNSRMHRCIDQNCPQTQRRI